VSDPSPEVSRQSAPVHKISGSRFSFCRLQNSKERTLMGCFPNLQRAKYAAWTWSLPFIERNGPKADLALRTAHSNGFCVSWVCVGSSSDAEFKSPPPAFCCEQTQAYVPFGEGLGFGGGQAAFFESRWRLDLQHLFGLPVFVETGIYPHAGFGMPMPVQNPQNIRSGL
jgi:hypothetical protein